MTPLDALSPDDGYGHRPLSWIDTVFVHHDAASFNIISHSETAERARIAQVRAQHRAQGWPDIAYSLYVFPSGRWYQTGALDTIRFATAGPDDPTTPQVISTYNEHGIGLCFAGLFVDGAEPTAEALAGALEAIRWCEEQVGRKLGVMGHRDVYATTCPGTNWHEWRNELIEPEQEEETMDIEKLRAALDVVWDVRRVLTGVDDASAKESVVNMLRTNAERLWDMKHQAETQALQWAAACMEEQSAELLQAVIDAKEAAGLQDG